MATQKGETVFLLASGGNVFRIGRLTFGRKEFANMIQFIS